MAGQGLPLGCGGQMPVGCCVVLQAGLLWHGFDSAEIPGFSQGFALKAHSPAPVLALGSSPSQAGGDWKAKPNTAG